MATQAVPPLLNVRFRPIAEIAQRVEDDPMSPLLSFAITAALQAETPTTPSDDGTIIMSVAAQPENCNVRVAKELALEALIKRPDQWAGQCVAVTGYWFGRALFRTPLEARQRYSQSSHELDGRRVGIYGREEVLKSAPKRLGLFIAVGVANTCEGLSEGAIMLMGYCHYTGGPIIAVAEMRPR